MHKEELQQIKRKIIQDIESLNQELTELQEMVKPIAPDCSLGEVIRQEMMQEQQVYEHTFHEAKIRLNKLNYALQKIEKEGYGICMECEEDIAFLRLMILPESSHCVSCMNELSL